MIAESALTGNNVWVALIVVVGQLAGSILTWFLSKRNSVKLDKAIRKVDEGTAAQLETKHEINSRLSELLASVRTESLAAGRLAGIEEQKRRYEKGDKGEME